jgi:hypothetical protein
MGRLQELAGRLLRSAVPVLHRIWLEITGTIFLGMAAFGGLSLWKEWRAYRAGGPPWQFLLALAFVVMMGSFAAHSFLRARRLREPDQGDRDFGR